jgi:hypothetical protein
LDKIIFEEIKSNIIELYDIDSKINDLNTEINNLKEENVAELNNQYSMKNSEIYSNINAVLNGEEYKGKETDVKETDVLDQIGLMKDTSYLDKLIYLWVLVFEYKNKYPGEKHQLVLHTPGRIKNVYKYNSSTGKFEIRDRFRDTKVEDNSFIKLLLNTINENPKLVKDDIVIGNSLMYAILNAFNDLRRSSGKRQTRKQKQKQKRTQKRR